jgi:hypothetical protein
MGMYNDYSNVKRTEWKFNYSGQELLEAARQKHAEFLRKEKNAREQMASMMMDMTVAQSDSRMSECKNEIEKAGQERERCMVWIHEFTRKPEREFLLSLGDVTYFNLAPEPEEK